MKATRAARRRPRRAPEARAEILAAAARAIAAHGYHGMSMRDLARATDRAIASFYSHFASKEDVLFALQTDAFETLIGSLQRALVGIESPVARLYGFVFNHVRYVVEHPDSMRVLIHEAAALPPLRRKAVRSLKERYFRIVQEIVRAIFAGEGDAAEIERATYNIFGMLNWVYGWYRPERHGTAQDVARSIHRMALSGMIARAAHRPVQEAMDRHLLTLEAPPLISAGARREKGR
jgi:AcrR family transcriptional regulator